MDKIKLTGGHRNFSPSSPIIQVTGSGRYTYLWVGNNSDDDKKCFGYTVGPKTLENFAISILKALKSKHLKP